MAKATNNEENNGSITLPAVPKKKSAGLGAVYRESTTAVAELFGGVSQLATAGRMLGQNAKSQAALARIESANEIAEALGLEQTGVQALVTANSVVDYIAAL